MIEIKNVSKTYGKGKNAFVALKDINLTLEDNSSVAIVGKSGSGKSTLMHAISGLDKPQQGQVLVDGQDILKLKPRDTDKFRAEQMSFVFQSFFVEAGETCYDNVSLSLETAGVPASERRERIEWALKSVDLADKINVRAGDLSGGQKQRLAIARAIVSKPSILFADEPTGNLDSATSKVVEDLLFDYQAQEQAILIIVTHDEELASRCAHLVRIKDGEVIESVSNSGIQNTSSASRVLSTGSKARPWRSADGAKAPVTASRRPAGVLKSKPKSKTSKITSISLNNTKKGAK